MHCSTPAFLFDHLVGASEHARWHFDAERLGSLEVDHQLVLGWLLDRKIARLLTLEDAVDVAGRVPVSGDLQRHLAHSWRPRRSAALCLLGCVLAAQDPRGDGGAGSHHSRQRQARPTMMRSCSPSPTASTSGGRMLASMSPSARVGTFASVRPWPSWSLRCRQALSCAYAGGGAARRIHPHHCLPRSQAPDGPPWQPVRVGTYRLIA
jgi:hypothetical protein